MIDQLARDQVVVSFPGLGIDEFILNKVALKLGGLEIRWYGVVIALGMVLAFLHAGYRAKGYKISTDDVLDLGLFSIIFGVMGARLYYVIMEHEMYDSFYEVIAIWNGGLAIYGGIIGGALAVLGVSLYKSRKNKNISFVKCADMILPGVMIAQSLGRWGNFFNGEAYGGIVAEGSPLYFIRMGIFPNNVSTGIAYVHPTFLYESLWNLVGFGLINLFWKRKKFNGEISLWYATWYGLGRMFIEGLRTDSLYVGSIRISQLIGFLCMVIGLLTIITLRILIHKNVINPSNDAVGAAIAASADELGDTSEESEKTNENEENKNGKDN